MNPFAEEPSSSAMIEEEKMKKYLFKNAMKGNWDEVIKIYQQQKEVAHNAKITRSGDTAIHIAISDGQAAAVEKLVSMASTATLKIKNELGNTPLHLAASLGDVRMCECIAQREVELVGIRNNDSETPLVGIRNNDSETPFFLAVHHGRKHAFLCLHKFCKGKGYTYARRNDGETILHSAINGDYFDIAFQIIHLYEKLVNSVNEQGFSPLHLLAGKPSAFRSGSHARGFQRLIYHCIFVDELEEESSYDLSQDLEYGPNKKYPENYQTCAAFVISLNNLITLLMGRDTKATSRRLDANDRKGGSSKKLIHDQQVDAVGQQLDPTQDGSSKKWNNRQVDAEGQQSDPEQGCFSKKYWKNEQVDAEGQQLDPTQAQGSSISRTQGHQFFPDNYLTCFHGLKFLSKAMLVILGLGSMQIVKLREKKEKHLWSVQIMEKLLKHASTYEYEDNGRNPIHSAPRKDGETTPYDLIDGGLVHFSKSLMEMDPMVHDDRDAQPSADNSSKLATQEKRKGDETDRKEINALEMEKKETPLLIAAKNGVMEMVERILDEFPVAIHDMNDEKKNIVLLAVENRQPHVYKFLLGLKLMKEIIFRKRDKDGNSALHLAAGLGGHRPWLIPGAALQMQWEIKWYEFVKDSMPHHFFVRYNSKGETARHIFSATHHKLVEEGGQWLTTTSESCSLVAALIATVAFATSSTVPGGVKQESGTPTLETQPAFSIFAVSSLVALCFSVTAVVMFLAILTSRYQERDFGRSLPNKLLVGLTSLFVSIASMLVSFCAGHFFVLKDKLKYAAFPVYAVTCLPVTFFAVAQFPLYFDLVKATFKKVPQRSYK